MNTVQAFIWNVGTYGLVLRESAKWTNRKVQSTDTVIGAEWLVVGFLKRKQSEEVTVSKQSK